MYNLYYIQMEQNLNESLPKINFENTFGIYPRYFRNLSEIFSESLINPIAREKNGRGKIGE